MDETTRKIQAGWRLPAGLVMRIRREAVERECRPSQVVIDRLTRSYVGCPCGASEEPRGRKAKA